MSKDLFSFDDSIEKEFDEHHKNYDAELKKAKIYCIRGQYEKAIDIYNAILEEDMENEDAYVGLLRAHSEDFNVLEGEDIDIDIRTIETLFPEIENEEYIAYLKKRKEFFTGGSESTKKARSLKNIDDILAEADRLYEAESYSDAYTFYERAAKLGSAMANIRMGYLVYNGLGVNKNTKAALELYLKAAEMGEYYAYYLLGLLYMNDIGDDAKAFKYFDTGVKEGKDRSCAAGAGYMYMYGKGVTKDYGLAFELLNIGLEAEPALALPCLGYLFENGYGTEKNIERALELYKRASEEYGDEYSKGRVKALTTKGIFSWLLSH